MVRVLVTGATGTLGTALRPRLQEAGNEVRAASRSPPSDGDVDWVELDLQRAANVDTAVEGVDVVIHSATAPRGDSEAVDVEGTRRLLEASEEAGVSNVVYPSIVGVDEIPYSYYRHKLAAEQAIEASDVPGTILRATQFHSFVDEVLGMVARLPAWPLPTRFRLQPVSVGEVADAIVKRATPEASGRAPAVGGPDVRTVGELARAYRGARGLRRPVVRLPLPGAVARGFREGHATCPDRAVGSTTWEEWLEAQYGSGRSTTAEPAGSPT